ncbi:MAG TPA: type IV pilin protein, partial [Cellvibrio sp.]|nr:type IV pilin protein [Cellvibrio sp.]
MFKKDQGFTLIETLITVLIVGVLASIAYTSYYKQVQKSNRSDAKVALNETAQRLQRCFTTYFTYEPASGLCKAADEVLSAGVKSVEGFYLVQASSVAYTSTTYVLEAKPIAGKRQEKDETCKIISLDQT